jgi:hypothetical protein
VDIEVILDAAESEAPGLRELARRFLEAEAQHLGVTLDLASVMARRTEGVPEMHIAGAADRLAQHLASRRDVLSEDSAFMVLARSGAQAMVTRAEMNDGYTSEPGRSR